jgi:hypothetical protein
MFTLVSERRETREAVLLLVRRVRNLAAARAKYASNDMPSDFFEAVFAAHDDFELEAKRELGTGVSHTPHRQRGCQRSR